MRYNKKKKTKAKDFLKNLSKKERKAIMCSINSNSMDEVKRELDTYNYNMDHLDEYQESKRLAIDAARSVGVMGMDLFSLISKNINDKMVDEGYGIVSDESSFDVHDALYDEHSIYPPKPHIVKLLNSWGYDRYGARASVIKSEYFGNTIILADAELPEYSGAWDNYYEEEFTNGQKEK